MTSVQYHTARKFRIEYLNMWNTAPITTSGTVLAKYINILFVPNYPVYGSWYERFMAEIHTRMGNDVQPDLVISLECMHTLIHELELDYLVLPS